MNIEELIKLAEPIFNKIDKAMEAHNTKECFSLFDTPQPEAWIESEQSNLIPERIYFYNNIQLVEAIMKRVFGFYLCEIKNNYTTNDKGNFASTTTVIIEIMVGGTHVYKYGIASSYAESIRHLTLATPLSFVEAKKNAIKQIGNLFGKSLNRFTEDAPLPVIQIVKSDEADIEFNVVKEKVISISNKADAEMYLSSTTFKYNVELKKIINSKK